LHTKIYITSLHKIWLAKSGHAKCNTISTIHKTDFAIALVGVARPSDFDPLSWCYQDTMRREIQSVSVRRDEAVAIDATIPLAKKLRGPKQPYNSKPGPKEVSCPSMLGNRKVCQML
jgi:hypothetical protein